MLVLGAIDNPPITDRDLRLSTPKHYARENRGLSKSEEALGRVEVWSHAQVAAAGQAHWSRLQQQFGERSKL